MEILINNLNLKTMQAVLKKISSIEKYNGAWLNLENTLDKELVELRQLATVQSIGSSTRIEGSALDNDAIDGFIKNIKKTSFTSRDEQEVMGYFETLDTIFESYVEIDLTENNVKHLHKSLLKYAKKDKHHLGDYKKINNSVVATHANGMQTTIFNTTLPLQTPFAMENAVKWTQNALQTGEVHPLIIIAAFIFEFLSIHPFQDGNGRLSRLLTTLLLLREKYFYIQYISFEHQIELRKKLYYATLRNGQATRGTDKENMNEFLLFFLECMEQMTIALDKKYKLLLQRGKYTNKRQANIVQFIKRKGTAKLADVAGAFKTVSNAAIKKDLQHLSAINKIEKTGKLKGTIYVMPE